MSRSSIPSTLVSQNAATDGGRSVRLLAALGAMVAVQLVLLAVTAVDPHTLLEMMPWRRGAVPAASPILTLLAQVLVLLATAMTFWRTALVARYRPTADVGDERLPHLTVIVPAYNEGRQVLLTLRSLAASAYPRDRLQIIAVDDGSVDDTWSWIMQGHEELGSLVTPIRCAKNGGKKHALAEGIRRAAGSVIVTVDSDSEVLPDTLRLLVAPLVIDERCGAVAGNVHVLNRDSGPIPKMLDAAFTVAFDFARAAESEVGGVMCSPGALSAFRTDLLRSFLNEWLDQTFFGQPATIGEDRALTNLILRGGSTVAYQSNSIVLTQVPTTAKVLCKMLLRWGRSDVRESIVLATILFRNHGSAPRAARRGLKVIFLWTTLRFVLSAVFFVPSMLALVVYPSLLPVAVLLTVLSSVPTLAIALATRDRRVALWAFPWALYAMVVTSWIAPWSFLTLHKGGWLTRGATTNTLVPGPAMGLLPSRETAT
jgi:hyaluronan synthase